MLTNQTTKRFGWMVCVSALAALACSAPITAGSPAAATVTVPAEPTTAAPVETSPAAAVTNRVLIQNKALDLEIVDANGQVTPFANAGVKVALAPYQRAGMAGGKVYAVIDRMTNAPPEASVIDASEAQPLAFISQMPEGLIVWPGTESQPARIAWSEVDFQATSPVTPSDASAEVPFSNTVTSQLMTAEVTAASGTVAYETTSDQGLYVVPFRWTPDGQTLYFSMEPSGLGGYILFDGHSSLYRLDVASGQVTEIVAIDVTRTTICVDDLSFDFMKVADHCDEQIGVTNLQTGQRTSISPPAEIPPNSIGQHGDAAFSPDGTRLAFAMARGEPGNEQGWVAVTDDLSGSSRLVATGAAGAFYSVLGWLDNDHLLLAYHDGLNDSIQILALDGSQPREVATGSTFIAFVP